MRVLLTGANGFIGKYLVGALLQAGHDVVPAVRRPAEMDRLLPRPVSIAVDFNQDVDPETWEPRLAEIDAVINCAGLLQGRPGQSLTAIHSAAPRALFTACRTRGVKRVIQISAISAKEAAGTAYASTKADADAFLAQTDLDWVILRPSLVYAEGAYGGTALFRAMAALPLAVPVVGSGSQVFQPIHVDDLSATVIRILDQPHIRRTVLEPVGPDTLTLREILRDLRRWLGIRPARVIEVPLWLVRPVTRLGDMVGGSMNSTALRQLEFGNVGRPEDFVQAIGIRPRRWRDALLARPAQTQDRWHARLYFVRPLLRWTLALLWLLSGAIGLLQPTSVAQGVLTAAGLPRQLAPVAALGACLVDLLIGIALVARWRVGVLAIAQLIVVTAYTAVLTYAQPSLWMEPYGPLLKNLPTVAAILAWAAVERDR